MRIRLLREAGGVGDVVCALGCATAIKRVMPDARVDFYSLDCYEELVGLCPDVDRFVGVPFNIRRERDEVPDRRRHRYLRDGNADVDVDLYCPGWRHEWATQGNVVDGRAVLFCRRTAEQTGLALTPRPMRVCLTERDRGRAEGWMEGKGVDLRRLIVGIQPQANLAARTWPEDRWRELLDVMRILLPGAQVICFGTHRDTRELARKLKTVEAIYLPYRLATSILERCDVLVGVDSGFYHLAAGTGTPAVGIFGVTDGESTSQVYPKAVYVEAGDEERKRAGCDCIRHCYNMPSAGKQPRCNTGPCPAMAEIPIYRIVEKLITLVGSMGYKLRKL